MTDLTRIGTLIVATGMLTTALLPKRQTVGALNAFFNGMSRWQGTAMGTAKPA